ncbi:MAG: glycine--tRNA ligase subunit beta, partial [Candidatus Bipolaricaulia bacterium]
MADLLLEIGTEELPASELPLLGEGLERRAKAALKENLLDYHSLRVFYTPRRLVLHIEGLAERQEDRLEEVLGPAARVAFAEDGSPTAAARGFARGHGVGVKDLQVKETEKGRYLFIEKQIPGRAAAEVLPEILPPLIEGLPAAETLRWEATGLRFIRPIRWLLCLLDSQPLALELGSIRSGSKTRLHRFAEPSEVEVQDVDDYFRRLREDLVILDPDARRRRIEEGLKKLAGEAGGRPRAEPEFIEYLTNSVEYPTPVLGEFDPRFLSLPQEVIFTTLREEGHFVPLVDREGRALPYFVGFRDGPEDEQGLVKKGYERILRAKLVDSEYFFNIDRRRRLEDYVAELRDVIYQERLGTIRDKVERIRQIAVEIGRRAGFKNLEKIDRAALLCKADLVTQMVGEFPLLEGVIGGIYAALDGEPEEVAQGIKEHYLPRSRGDRLPKTEVGIAVSLADKLDTIVGSILIGEEPTGSRDPYGLRRKANGIVRITLGRELDLDLYRLIRDLDGLYDFLEEREPLERVIDFLNERLYQILLQEYGLDYDILDATTSVGEGSLWRVLLKSRA